MARAHPDHTMISSDRVQGTRVYDRAGDHVGDIDHLMIDKATGHVNYAVISFGGILGLGHSHYPIPWSALRYDVAREGYETGISKEQLEDAPEFSDDSWTDRDWENRVHTHYRAEQYWL